MYGSKNSRGKSFMQCNRVMVFMDFNLWNQKKKTNTNYSTEHPFKVWALYEVNYRVATSD